MRDRTSDIEYPADELAAAVMTLTAMVVQLRARLRLMEMFLDREVRDFDRERYKRFVTENLDEVQAAIEERTREVLRNTQPFARAEVQAFFHSLSQDIPQVLDPGPDLSGRPVPTT